MKNILLLILSLCIFSSVIAQKNISMEAPPSATQFGVAEFVFKVNGYRINNPFTDIEINGTFTSGKSGQTSS